MADVFSRADWALHSEEFAHLVEYRNRFGEVEVGMEIAAPGIDNEALVEPLRALWLELPPHNNVLQAVERAEPFGTVVKYAALNWKLEPLDVDRDKRAEVVAATWGVELTRLFDFVRACTSVDEAGWFACPFVKIDVLGVPRVGFMSPAGSVALMNRVAPEVVRNWPACDHVGFVYAVGQLLLGLIRTTSQTASSALGTIIMRCLSPTPRRRHESLATLRDALVDIGGRRNSRVHAERPIVWSDVEDGIGHMAWRHWEPAMRRFERALSHDPRSRSATDGYNAMVRAGVTPSIATVDAFAALESQLDVERRRLARLHEPFIAPPQPERWRDWKEIRPVGRKLEEAGRYRDALEYYRTTKITDDVATELLVAIARCHLKAHEYGTAIDHAQRALAREPTNEEAHSIATDSWWQRKQFADALEANDAWIAALPDDANAHYFRAKILLGLGRIADARDECDRTTELSPKHLAALLLAWQLERSMKRIRSRAGHAAPAPLDLPEHLRHLRELLVTGRNPEAIAILSKPEYAADQIAQLLRADLLAFTDQPEAALAAYEALPGLAAAVGRAALLVKLDRASEALALCDTLVCDHSGSHEAHEARALALQALGRGDEADAAFKRALNADAQRSQARVKLAGR